MTVVLNSSSSKIFKESDVYDRYTGFGGNQEDMRMGGETERVYHDPANPEKIMSMEVESQFLDEVAKYRIPHPENPGFLKPIKTSEETVSQVVEEQTTACKWPSIRKVIEEERNAARVMHRVAEKLGVRQSIYTNNPLITHKECWENCNASRRDRTEKLVRGFHDHLSHDELSYTFLTSPVHCSVSYTDPDHLWGIARRMFYLTPFMYLAGDNGSGFMERSPKPLNHHYTMRTNQSLGARGGIPEHFFRSVCGEDYIRGHIEAVLNNPMVIYYDQNSETVTPADGRFPTLKQLAAVGLNTESNYDVAESTLWPDGKLCNIRDKNDIPIGKRFEIRMWDTGPHQFASMMLTCMATLMDPQGAEETDRLLGSYGFGEVPAYSEMLLRKAMNDTLYHGGRFMDIPFGAPTKGGVQRSMLDFSKELYPVIEASVARADKALLANLEPLKHICHTGWTDTKVSQHHCRTLEGVRKLMIDMPEDIYIRPKGTSFYLLRESGELPEVNPVANNSHLKLDSGFKPEGP